MHRGFSRGAQVGFHRIMVESSCESFMQTLAQLTCKSCENEFHVTPSDDDDDDDCFTQDDLKMLLEWLYTGKVTTTGDDNIKRILKWASFFEMEHLTTLAENLAAGPEFAVLNESFRTYVPDCLGKRAHEVYLKGQILTDLVFKHFGVHRAILACRSSFVRSAIRWQAENDSMRLCMPELSDDEAETIVYCLYTDQVDWECNKADPMRLLEVSDRFGLERLKSLCELQITKLVDAAITDSISKSDVDVVSLLNAASAYNAPQLESWCLFFLAKNFVALNQSSDTWLDKVSCAHKKHIQEHRWPPVSYLNAVEKHKAEHAEWEEKCDSIKRQHQSRCFARKNSATQRQRQDTPCAVM